MDPRKRGSASNVPLSLEASLEEENKAVLADLTKTRSRSPISKASRNRTPPPYRSMLDVNAPRSSTRHGSLPGSGGLGSGPNARDQRKTATRFDPADPSTWTAPAKPVPTETVGASQGLPKIQFDDGQGFEQTYNFDTASIPLSGGSGNPTQDKRTLDQPSIYARTDASARRPSKESVTTSISDRMSIPQAGTLSPEKPRKARTSSGSVSDGGRRRLSNKSSSFSSTAGSELASTRVMEDDDDEDALAESSDEDKKRSSSSDEESPEDGRGRIREEGQAKAGDIKQTTVERPLAPQSQGVKSLIEPLLSPSIPKESSGEVHPPSSFGRSGPTAADFAGEDDIDSDIKKAKALGSSISPVDNSVQGRHVRMVIRGDWMKFQDENENNNSSSPRLYLACTDLSTEASYALEWTIGTMLRDGDTLLAIYAIEDENAPKEPENNTQVMAESVKAAKDASDTMDTLTRQTTNLENKPSNKFIPAIDAPSAIDSIKSGQLTKKETERLRALDEIAQNFLKLVRRTPLQVRCMIEVIHCQSPKHLILNAIDTLEPTLCVVGTRGRSSLKGVLLGSFSNYLVTKSSVPVMVARRRLKKPHGAKVNSASIKQPNNLSNIGRGKARMSLDKARID